MVKSDNENKKGTASDSDLKFTIVKYIKNKGNVHLEELKKEFENTSRQTFSNNIRSLQRDKKIRAYLDIKPNPGAVLIKDDEIYFTLVIDSYSLPHEVERLIDDMCSKKDNIVPAAFNEFVDLYEKTVKCTPGQAKHTAYNLMARKMAGDVEEYNFSKDMAIRRLFGLPTIKPLWPDQEHLSHPSL